MKTLTILSLIAIWNAFIPHHNNSSQLNDYKIAYTVRKAVRAADSTLLKSKSFNIWRDYLKIAAMDLKLQLQPLVLIKFDEDMGFRNQLKTIIQWESQWQKRETEHFIYYYRWDQPPPEIILEVQDAHFNEIAKLFQIEAKEKIPFRYDLTVDSSTVYPYEDLRGGIVSSNPLDLYNGTKAIFYFVNTEPKCILEPLSIIYGSYYQNPSTSQAYYEKCTREIKKLGYISAENLYIQPMLAHTASQEWFSAYAFVYELNQQFGPQKIAQFVNQVSKEMPQDKFQMTFKAVFGESLSAFESKLKVEESAKKL
ncbi:MAG: hypothetical protein ACE5HI_20055 [bacterium]